MDYDLTFFEEKTKETDERLFQDKTHKDIINTVYGDKYAQKQYIGNCVGLFHELYPNSVQDFRDKLEAYAEEHKNDLAVFDRGPTNLELFEMANEFRNDCCKQCPEIGEIYDVMFFYNNLLYHQTTQTYYGEVKEKVWADYMTRNNLSWRHSTEWEEGNLCVDFFVLDENGKEIKAIQVKPFTFLFGTFPRNITDRNKLMPAMNKLKKSMNLDLVFAIYNAKFDKWMRNRNDGSFTIPFDDLFIRDGKTVKTRTDRYYLWANLP